jgi:hypothetical protein
MNAKELVVAGLLASVGVVAAFAIFSVVQPYIASAIPTPNA